MKREQFGVKNTFCKGAGKERTMHHRFSNVVVLVLPSPLRMDTSGAASAGLSVHGDFEPVMRNRAHMRTGKLYLLDISVGSSCRWNKSTEDLMLRSQGQLVLGLDKK